MRYNFHGEKMIKVKEDPNVKEVAKRLGLNYSYVCKLVLKHKLGYVRAGAGTYKFMTKEDIAKLQSILKNKHEYNRNI